MGITTPARDPVFKSGDVIEGRYRIIREIGSGGMGTVYLTEHVLIKRRLAVKVLHPEFATDAEVIERFMNEARAVGTLGHPNIVESTDMGFARDEMPYIVFEYLEGSALSDEVYRLQGLPVRRAMKIAHQIASALEAAHAAGIIHRDLKSDNIFLTHRDEVPDHVKVLDFGISRFTEQASDVSVGGRRANLAMGTPEFMAPEQVTSPESVDERTDIWALGVVFYEMLASRTPFVNENDSDALLHKIILEKPPELNRPEVPAGLVEMIFERMLAKEPAKRFQSMKDVKAALEAFWGATRRDSQPIEPISMEAVQAAAAAAGNPALAAAAAPKAAETVALPPARTKPSRGGAIVLAVLATLGILASVAGGMLMSKSGKRVAVADGVATTAIGDDATAVGAAIDAVANDVRMRAQGVASTPMLRAAIETDAATLQDMVHDGALFKPAAGEVVDLVQVRDGKHASLLRLPESAKPLGDDADAHVVVEGGQLRVIAGAPVTQANGNAVAGEVLISVPVDIQGAAGKVKTHALDARLEGLGAPVALVPGSHPEGEAVARPVQSKALKDH